MFCPNCGNKIADGARFCPECGTPIPAMQTKQPEIPRCPNCGTEIKDGGKFCPECGTPIPATQTKQPEIPRCPNCGTEIEDGGKFCPECGTPIPDVSAVSSGRVRFCPECGNKIEEGIRFCGACGTPIQTEPVVVEEVAAVMPATDVLQPAVEVEEVIANAEESVKEEMPVIEPQPVVEVEEETTVIEPQPAVEVEEEIPAEKEPATEEIPVIAPQPEVAIEEVAEEKHEEENVIFCSKCGNKMPADSRFCGVCGTPVTEETDASETAEEEKKPEALIEEEIPAEKETAKEEIPVIEPQPAVVIEEVSEEKRGEENVIFCSKCGNKMPADSKFCGVCGTPVENAAPTPEFETKESSFHAPIVSGEGSFGTVEVNGSAQESRGPGEVIGDAFKSLISSITAVFKNPIKLLPALILAGLWLIINILQGFGINILPVKAFSFLTFAEAGMHGGIIGAIGGIIGKGMFTGAVVSLIGLFTRKNGAKRSFGDILKGAFGVSAGSMFAYITGIGIAMLLYLFISGGATRVSFMGGVAAAFLAAKAALNNGFLKRLLGSFVPKGSKGASEGINGVIKGLSVGFAASAVIGLTGINLILIILGSLLVIAGGILWILQATGAIKIGSGVNVQ